MPSLRLPLLSRSLLTTLPAALALLGLVLLLAVTGQLPTSPSPVQAQTQPGVLVSNFGNNGTYGTSTYDSMASTRHTLATQFTTGSGATSGAYNLSSIAVRSHWDFATGTMSTLRAELWSAATTTHNPPHAKVYDLTVPDPVPGGGNEVTFTAPSHATLATSTKYYLVVYATDTADFGMLMNNANGEDSVSAAGWSIADENDYGIRSGSPPDGSSWQRFPTNIGTALIQVRGSEATTAVAVSNFGQTVLTGFGEATSTIGAFDSSQQYVVSTQFTTGSGTNTLASIAVKTPAGQATSTDGALKAELWSAGTGTGNPPDAKLYDLTVPDVSGGAQTVTFTAPPNATLAESAKHYLVVYTTDTTKFTMQVTNSDSEDAGSATGWSIADGAPWRMATGTPDAGTWAQDTHDQYGDTGLIQVSVYEAGESTPPPSLSSNADLSALTAATSSDGNNFNSLTLAPAFDKDTTAYTASVNNEVTQVKLTPTVDDTGKATVKVGKQGTTLASVTSGSASAAIALTTGANAIDVEVTAEDSSTKTYTVTITRRSALSSNANLSALTVATSTDNSDFTQSLTLTPAFDKDTTAYTGSVDTTVTHVKLTPTVEDTGKATVKVGESGGTLSTVASGSASGSIALASGENALEVEVTAEDSSTKTYTVTIRQGSTVEEPNGVENLAVQPGHQKLDVTWDANALGGTPTGYDVHYTASSTVGANAHVGSDVTTEWVDASHSGATTSATISSLDNGTEYRVRVRATNDGGNSRWRRASGTPLPTITLTSNATGGEVTEGDAALTLTATLSAAAGTSGVTVTVARVAADSTASNDDITLATTITVNSGDTTGTASLAIVDDKEDEDDETLVLSTSATGHIEAGGSSDRLTLTIKDNDDAGVTVSESSRTVEVGETTAYTVELDTKPTSNVTISATSDDTDKATVSPASRTFTTTNWNTAQTFTVSGKAVGTLDIDHAVSSSSDPKYPTSMSIDHVDVTVEASTKTYKIEKTKTVKEGASAALTVTLGQAPTDSAGHTLNVAYTYPSSTATAADLNSPPSTVTVAQSSTTATLTVPIAQDALVDGAESVTVTISTNASGWNPTEANANVATITITDDEAANAKIAFHASNAAATAAYTDSEDEDVSGGTLTVPVTISALPQTSTRFDIEVVSSGATATENTDFRIATKSVTFANTGTKTKNVSITLTNDAFVENDETIKLRIKAADATPNDLGDLYTRHSAGSTATLTIDDDDADDAKIAFGTNAAGTAKYTRGHNETASATVRVTVSHLPAESTTFTIETVTSGAGAGTATEYADAMNPGDFRIADKTVTFDSTGAKHRDVSISFEDDSLVENDQTIELRIQAADATPNDLGDLYTRHADASKAQVTIEDNEARAAKAAFGASAASTSKHTATPSETAGTLTVPITITALPEEESDFTVSVSGTATKNTDYTLSAETFTFAPTDDAATTDVDETSLTRNLEITITNDELVEDDQTIKLEIASGDGLFSKYERHAQGKLADVTIQDDEQRAAKIAIGASAASTTKHTKSGAEGDGTLTVPITISALPESDTKFAVEVLTTGTTARDSDDTNNPTGNPKDYEFVSKEVTFSSTGNRSMELTINIEDDFVEEDDETIQLRIVAADNPNNDLGDYYARDASGSTSTITLTSDDTVSKVTLMTNIDARSDGTIPAFEGGRLPMTVQSDIPVGPGGWTVTVERAPNDLYLRGGMAYASYCNQGRDDLTQGWACPNDITLPAKFTIREGQNEATGYLNVTRDTKREDVEEKLVLHAKANRGGTTLTTGTLQLRLIESSAGINLGAITLDLLPTETATYTVSLRGDAPSANVTVTPTSGDTDKATVSCATDPCVLTFTPGNYTDPQEITVTGVAAGTATITHVAASTDSEYSLSASALGSVRVTVIEAENTYRISPATTAAEGETAELTVTLGALAPSTSNPEFTVDRSRNNDVKVLDGSTPLPAEDGLADPSTDLGTLMTTLTVTAGERTYMLSEPIADDDLVEGEEHYYVVISTGESGWDAVDLGGPANRQTCAQDAACARVTITDPDAAEAKIAFGNSTTTTTAYTASADEGDGTLTVPVTITALPKSSTTFSIEVVTTGSGLATEATDYSIATKSVTFDSTDTTTTKNVTVAITNDSDPEGDETIQLRIVAADDPINDLGDHYQRDANGSRATLTITDNDGGVELSETGITVAPNGSTTYTIALNGATPASNVTVTPMSGDTDKATVSCSGTPPCALTFTPGNYRQAQTITVEGVAEGDTTISHTISGGGSAYSSLSVDSVNVTVTAATTATLSVSPNPVQEGRSVTVTVDLSESVGHLKTIPITLAAGTTNPAEAGDYGTLANVSIRSGSTRATGTITTSQDVDTDDETFTVALDLSGITGLAAGSPISETVTIEDDDTPLEAISSLTVRPANEALSVSWSRPTGTTIEGYHVHYTSADASTVADDAPVNTDAAVGADTAWKDAGHSGTGRSYTIRSLENGTEYRVRVRAVNSVQTDTPWSAVATGTPAVPPRRAPTPPSLSGDATLRTLGLSDLTLVPEFNPATTEYTAEIDFLETTTVEAMATHHAATVAGTGEKTLVAGENTISVTVTAENGSTRTYTVTVTVSLPEDATLSGLSLKRLPMNMMAGTPVELTDMDGTVVDFDSGKTTYHADAGSAEEITVTAMATHSEADLSVTVNGEDVMMTDIPAYWDMLGCAAKNDAVGADDEPDDETSPYCALYDDLSDDARTVVDETFANYYDVPLMAGQNTISVMVTAEDGQATVTYTVTVTVTVPEDATLSGLSLKRLPMNMMAGTPVELTDMDGTVVDFDSGKTTYHADAGSAEEITVTAMATHSEADLSVTVNGEDVMMTDIPAYWDMLGCAAKNDAVGADDEPDDETSPYCALYDDLSDDARTVVDETFANYYDIPLMAGQNTISVMVTAEDGQATVTYTVTVTVTVPEDATLSGLSLKRLPMNMMAGMPVELTDMDGTAVDFDSGKTSYYADAGSAEKITVTAMATHSEADLSVTVSGEDVMMTDIPTYWEMLGCPAKNDAVGADDQPDDETSPYCALYDDLGDDAKMVVDAAFANYYDIPLTAGRNTISVTVTAEDEEATVTYTVTVTRGVMDDESRLLDIYDLNNDDMIDGTELGNAIVDYLNGDLPPSDMGVLIGLYLHPDRDANAVLDEEEDLELAAAVKSKLHTLYDADVSGDNDLEEVNVAIDHFFDGIITLEQVSIVIDLFFAPAITAGSTRSEGVTALMLHRYDLNANGSIEKEEALEAVDDYLFGGYELLTKEAVVAIVDAYLFA